MTVKTHLEVRERIQSLTRQELEDLALRVVEAFYFGHATDEDEPIWDYHAEWDSACDVTDAIYGAVPGRLLDLIKYISPEGHYVDSDTTPETANV